MSYDPWSRLRQQFAQTGGSGGFRFDAGGGGVVPITQPNNAGSTKSPPAVTGHAAPTLPISIGKVNIFSTSPTPMPNPIIPNNLSLYSPLLGDLALPTQAQIGQGAAALSQLRNQFIQSDINAGRSNVYPNLTLAPGVVVPNSSAIVYGGSAYTPNTPQGVPNINIAFPTPPNTFSPFPNQNVGPQSAAGGGAGVLNPLGSLIDGSNAGASGMGGGLSSFISSPIGILLAIGLLILAGKGK